MNKLSYYNSTIFAAWATDQTSAVSLLSRGGALFPWRSSQGGLPKSVSNLSSRVCLRTIFQIWQGGCGRNLFDLKGVWGWAL